MTPYAALNGNDLDWLKARLHVAIAGLGYPTHGPVGPLMAWNDDEFAAGSGFPVHRHQDVEILTYVQRGAITHEYSIGNRGIVRAGDVQAMSASSGIRHAEFNDTGETTAVYQIWLRSRSTSGRLRGEPGASRAQRTGRLGRAGERPCGRLPLQRGRGRRCAADQRGCAPARSHPAPRRHRRTQAGIEIVLAELV